MFSILKTEIYLYNMGSLLKNDLGYLLMTPSNEVTTNACRRQVKAVAWHLVVKVEIATHRDSLCTNATQFCYDHLIINWRGRSRQNINGMGGLTYM